MINKRQISDTASLLEIEQLKNQFPYCATFQLLYAIGLSQSDNIHQKQQINLASLYISERSKLYQYTTTKTQLPDLYPVSHNIPYQEIQTTIEVNSDSAASPSDKPVSPAIETAVEVGAFIEAPNKDKQDSAGESLISEKPLEEEILRSAVVQLGEIAIEELINNPLPAIVHTPPKLQIRVSDSGSFGDWLIAVDRGSFEHTSAESTAIIEKFIQESPQITPVKHSFFSPAQVGKQSLIEDESLVTETLARIYERQGDYKRAARAFANLSLKFPEKSVYFAALQKQAEEKFKN
jgi:hypothetical protein